MSKSIYRHDRVDEERDVVPAESGTPSDCKHQSAADTHRHEVVHIARPGNAQKWSEMMSKLAHFVSIRSMIESSVGSGALYAMPAERERDKKEREGSNWAHDWIASSAQ